MLRTGLAVIVALPSVLVAAGSARLAPAQAKGTCSAKAGTAVGDLWPQRRLDFQRIWPITRGAGQRVAVIDSGVDFSAPQLVGIHHGAGVSVIPTLDPGTNDCLGHGTAVTGIIAAQPEANEAFLGVAPDVTIIPIKQTNTNDDTSGTADGIAAGIEQAIRLRATVANISVTATAPTASLARAVTDARTHHLVIVAAAGNDGSTTKAKAYPAAYSTSNDNVIAVSAIDSKDVVATLSSGGGYVTVAAPGQGVPAPATSRGYLTQDGTSFAAAYVTGTVALLLAAHPTMTPVEVRNRLEATADPPPANVPDPQYGYGVVNPYLAVTSLRADSSAPRSAARAAPLPAPQAAKPADRGLQHLALATAVVLVGLTALTLLGAAVLRGRRREPVGAPAPADRGRYAGEPDVRVPAPRPRVE